MSCFMMFLLADVSQDEQQSDREKQYSNDHQRSRDPAPVVLVCVRQYWVLHDENVQHSLARTHNHLIRWSQYQENFVTRRI